MNFSPPDLHKITVVLLWVSLCAIPAAALADAESIVVIENAWSPQMPPSISVVAGYMAAVNVSAKPVTVTGFSSSAYQYVEMHRSLIDDGVANMVEVKTLRINPGERIEFYPGGLHLMLINRQPANTSAKTLPITLYLDGGGPVNFVLDIVPRHAQPIEMGKSPDHSVHRHHGS